MNFSYGSLLKERGEEEVEPNTFSSTTTQYKEGVLLREVKVETRYRT